MIKYDVDCDKCNNADNSTEDNNRINDDNNNDEKVDDKLSRGF